MKKEVIYVPKDKDFFEFIEERFSKINIDIWVYIDKKTVDMLSNKEGVSYLDSKGNLYISYGNIIIDSYKFETYSWYRIKFIDDGCNVIYKAGEDPEEIFFISIQ